MIKFCRYCNEAMRHVISFSEDPPLEYFRCANCHYETRKRIYNFPGKTKKKRKQKD